MNNLTIAFCLLATLMIAGCAVSDSARKAAASRTRRVIFNNDGDDALHYGRFHTDPDAPVTREGFLALRMDHIGDTGLDSVFYCTTQSINAFTHHSEVTEVFETTEGDFSGNRTRDLIDIGADPLQVAIDACREHDIEIFWTIRMNDIHDNFWNEMLSQWKKDHPHLLMGKPEDKSTYPSSDARHVWTWADFDHQEVRDLMVTIVRDVLDRYDVDGIDLDFLRHPAFFKQSLVSQSATLAQVDRMTDMVRDIRQEVLAASTRRGRPILLSVRILPTLELNRRWGFDAERWGTEKLVDFIAVGGGYDPFTMPVRDMVERGHTWGMPVYVCLSTSGFRSSSSGGAEGSRLSSSVECWRAAAANAWQTGADGIMTFNLFPRLPNSEITHRARQIWKEISDPKALGQLDKIYCIENLTNNWNFGASVRSIPITGRLPKLVPRGVSVERIFPVADDVAGAGDRLESLELRIHFSDLLATDKLTTSINGVELSMSAEAPGWLKGDVPPDAMVSGDNKLGVTYESGESDSLTLTSVDLTICYRQRSR